MTPERPLDPPEHKAFTGRVVFAAYVNDETVEVKAKIVEDRIDWDATEIEWHGIDVLALLSSEQTKSIDRQFDERYADIINLYQE